MMRALSTGAGRQAGVSKIGLLIIGAVIGAAVVISIPVAVNATGSNEFCISCHEMKVAEKEYLESSHAVNASGVVTKCADCHIPHNYPEKLFLKTEKGIHDIVGHLTEVIDTPEKFEAHRRTMAQSEWDRMKANDSAECRHCHALDEKIIAKQTKAAIRDHRKGLEQKKTCIECHIGLVHEEPAQAPGGKSEEKDAPTNKAD